MPPAGSSNCTWQLQKHRSAKSSWHGREAQHCHSDRLGPIARGPTLAMDIRKQPIDYAGFTPGVVPYLRAIVLYMLSTHQRMTHLQTFPFQRVLQDQAAWGNQTLVEEAAAAAAQAHAAAARLASSHARSAADKTQRVATSDASCVPATPRHSEVSAPHTLPQVCGWLRVGTLHTQQAVSCHLATDVAKLVRVWQCDGSVCAGR